MMDLTLIVTVILATVSGLAFLAYRHPLRFRTRIGELLEDATFG